MWFFTVGGCHNPAAEPGVATKESPSHSSFILSTYVANKNNKQETIRSQLQSSVTSILTTHFFIIDLINQPFTPTGLIFVDSFQIMSAYLTMITHGSRLLVKQVTQF